MNQFSEVFQPSPEFERYLAQVDCQLVFPMVTEPARFQAVSKTNDELLSDGERSWSGWWYSTLPGGMTKRLLR